MQSTQPNLSTLRSAARARGFEIDLSSGQLEMFLLADPDAVVFTASWPVGDERAEQEARHWLSKRLEVA
jgi:hypothetical protein